MFATVLRRFVTAAVAVAYCLVPSSVSAERQIVLQAECVYYDASGAIMPRIRSNPLVLSVREPLQRVNAWLVNGPHYPGVGGPSLWWDPFNGEAWILPYAGMTSRMRTWQPAATDASGVLDLKQSFGDVRLTLGYAYALIHSPVDQPALLLAGSDDSLRVYLNGRTVLFRSGVRSFVPDHDRVAVDLKAGVNRLLVKAAKWSGPWRLSVRIESAQRVTVLAPAAQPPDSVRFYVREDAPAGGDGLSWDAAFGDIQTAIDAAAQAGGGEVWIAGGLYVRSLRLKPGVSLFGGFLGYEQSLDERDIQAYPTVIRAAGASFAVRGADTCSIDGLKITGGSIGVYCDGTSPVIRNCDIYACDTGLMAINNAVPAVFACRIYSNRWYGIQCHFGSSVVVRRSVITGNNRVAVYCYTASNAEISDCIIERNGLHGLLSEYSSPRVSGCTLAKNGGFAVHSRSSNVTVVNSIIWRNGWNGGGALAVTTGSPPVVRSTCFWDNGPAQFVGLESPVGRNGNVQSDPCFVDPDGSLYVPAAGSACIETGDNTCVVNDSDVWGGRRVIRRAVDLGAVEAQ